MTPIVHVEKLSKTYSVTDREGGLKAALKNLINRKKRDVKAVNEVSFDIEAGEIVGFLGPNGAGKTTTLKMLSGLLHPTAGVGQVLGFTPYKRERAYLSQMTLVMGQRNQLIWDIPATDSFDLNRVVYRLNPDDFKRTRDELVDLLELAPIITKPVRNLSLGERMKCEIAAALLHRPKVLFLDEPTLGLDVTSQRRIRAFIKDYNAKYGATVLLTSHYMADIEALCKRVIIIHHGKLIFDGELSQLAHQFSADKTISATLENPPENTDAFKVYGEVLGYEDGQIRLKIPKQNTSAMISKLLSEWSVLDVSIQEPPIEDVIEHIFASPKETSA
ncbi:MAG: ATP-binding cassette domain-containing protein [bacterium]|nr:ATP-binding cassette domain-containing protein [bacterium]